MDNRYTKMLTPREMELNVLGNISYEQQRIFRAFRESFALTSGDQTLSLYFALALVQANRYLFLAYPPASEKRPAEETPAYIKYTHAPINHTASGKDSEDPKRLDEIDKQWTYFPYALDQLRTNSKYIYEFLNSFIKRDIIYVSGTYSNPDPESTAKPRKVGRATVTDNRASFLRELILKDALDSYLSLDIVRLINEMRLIIEPYMNFLQELDQTGGEEKLISLAEKLMIAHYKEDIFPNKTDAEILEFFKHPEFQNVITLFIRSAIQQLCDESKFVIEDLSLLQRLKELKEEWEEKHPEEKFFEIYPKISES